MFHYRSRGMEYGSVLCAFEVDDNGVDELNRHLNELGYEYNEVSDDPAYTQYMKP